MEAIKLYSWFGIGTFVSLIIGALLGDLVIGNKKTIILGAFFQSFGAFCLCIPSLTYVYIGLFFISLGSGFYRPNLTSLFGKNYLNKTKLLDSGFAILYLASIIGSFLGSFTIGYLGDNFGYNVGFSIVGVLSLLSIIPILISNEIYENEDLEEKKYSSSLILKSGLLLLIVGLFWGIYELSNMYCLDIRQNLNKIPSIVNFQQFLQYTNSIFILPISIVTIFLWTFIYKSSTFKLMIGFILAMVSYIFLLCIPELNSQNQFITYFLAMLFLSISELHIGPIVNSILTRYSNPKYLTITFCIAFLSIKLVSLIFIRLFQDSINHPTVELIFSTIIIALISLGLIVYLVKKHKKNGTK